MTKPPEVPHVADPVGDPVPRAHGAVLREDKDTFLNALRPFQPHPTGQIPTPGSPWEAWAAYRIDMHESQQSWMMRLIIGRRVRSTISCEVTA